MASARRNDDHFAARVAQDVLDGAAVHVSVGGSRTFTIPTASR